MIEIRKHNTSVDSMTLEISRKIREQQRTGLDMPAKLALFKIFNKTSSNYIWLDR